MPRRTHAHGYSALFIPGLALALAFPLSGCPTRDPDHDDVQFVDATTDTISWDPRVPTVGAGSGLPSCSPEATVDVNMFAFHEGDRYRIRVDTHGRRNDLHPGCVERDAPEAVLRYTVPPMNNGVAVHAIRVSTENPDTEYDTVLAVRNDCTSENSHDYSCNNDGTTPDGQETRHSVVYFTDLEPEQYVYVLVDGFDGSQGIADVTVDEIRDVGTVGNPCFPVPPERASDPTANVAPERCADAHLQCRPGAAPDGTDICLPLVGLGQPCDPEEFRNVCQVYSGQGIICAQNPISRTEAVCALPGTAAGALCRPADPKCDGQLICSPGAGFNNQSICVPLRGNGAACDPATVAFTNHCAQGLSCCGDSPDAGASFYCRPDGTMPCYPPAPMTQ